MPRVRYGVARHRAKSGFSRKPVDSSELEAASTKPPASRSFDLRSSQPATAEIASGCIAVCGSPGSSAACQGTDLSYSRFIHGLKKANVDLDRKMISELAIRNPEAFSSLVGIARGALS